MLGIKKVSQMTGINRNYIYVWAKNNLIPYSEIKHGKYMFSEEDIKNIVDYVNNIKQNYTTARNAAVILKSSLYLVSRLTKDGFIRRYSDYENFKGYNLYIYKTDEVYDLKKELENGIIIGLDPNVEYRKVDWLDNFLFGCDGSIWNKGNSFFNIYKKVDYKPASKGYIRVPFTINGKTVRKNVSTLICEAWHGKATGGLECCHNDGNKLNNRPDNLRWDTHINNIQDKIIHNTVAKGSRHGRSSLSEEQVIEIRNKYNNEKYLYTDLMKEYNVSKSCISSIINRKTWTHL